MPAHSSQLIQRLRTFGTALAGAIVRLRIPLGVAAACLVLFTLAAGPVSLTVPAVCGGCHRDSGAYDEWHDSPHAEVGCQKCHLERGYLGGVGNSVALVTESWRTVFGGPDDPAWVPDEACRRCHPEIGTEETFSVGTLRMSHQGLAQGGYRCVDCHSDAAHEPEPAMMSQRTMAVCARCHDGNSARKECSVCHNDGSAGDAEKRHDQEWARTHGKNWKSLHGMGELSTCVLCHEPSKCEGCHGVPLPHGTGFAATHGALAMPSKDPCLAACHTAAFCDSCHGIEMPHPPSFLPGHPEIAEGLEDPLCDRCHTPATCNDCHRRHVHPGIAKPFRRAPSGTGG